MQTTGTWHRTALNDVLFLLPVSRNNYYVIPESFVANSADRLICLTRSATR